MTLDVTTQITPVTCSKCGTVCGINSAQYEQLRETHDTWYCPSGHPQMFRAKSETELVTEKLKHVTEDRDALQRLLDAQQERRRLAAAHMRAHKRGAKLKRK